MFGKVWWPMVVGRKSIAGGSFATALLPLLSAACVHCRTTLPLLSVRCSCYSCTCAAHKYVLGYLHAHTGQFSVVRVNSLSCTCSVQPCLGTTANSLRGVNFQQTQTSRKTITNVNYFPKFQNLEPACLPPN